MIRVWMYVVYIISAAPIQSGVYFTQNNATQNQLEPKKPELLHKYLQM